MNTTRIVLREPFVRHPPGLVFELDEAAGVSGWYDDDRLRDRQNFWDKRVYFLPDGGNGSSYELPLYMTTPCPPEVFEGVDLHVGPCRITGAWLAADGHEANAVPSNLKYDARLLEINGINAQGIGFELEQAPVNILLFDALRNEKLRDIEAGSQALNLDFSTLLPGFYKLIIHTRNGPTCFMRFIKSFPYLVEFKENSNYYELRRTLY